MRAWTTSLGRSRALELAAALLIGYTLARLAEAVAEIATVALAQHAGELPDAETYLPSVAAYALHFEVLGTLFVYGDALTAALALALVVVIGWVVVRRRDRTLGVCPFCASRIPHESTLCAYCGSSLAPGEP